MSYSLWDGNRFLLLNIIDDYNRDVLIKESDKSLPAIQLISVLEYSKDQIELPKIIHNDNGP